MAQLSICCVADHAHVLGRLHILPDEDGAVQRDEGGSGKDGGSHVDVVGDCCGQVDKSVFGAEHHREYAAGVA